MVLSRWPEFFVLYLLTGLLHATMPRSFWWRVKLMVAFLASQIPSIGAHFALSSELFWLTFFCIASCIAAFCVTVNFWRHPGQSWQRMLNSDLDATAVQQHATSLDMGVEIAPCAVATSASPAVVGQFVPDAQERVPIAQGQLLCEFAPVPRGVDGIAQVFPMRALADGTLIPDVGAMLATLACTDRPPEATSTVVSFNSGTTATTTSRSSQASAS